MGQLAATKAQQLVEEQQPLILQQLPTVPSAEPSASLQQQQSADNAQLSMGKTEEGILIHRDVELVVWRQEDLVIKDEFLGRGNFGQVRNGKLYVRGSGFNVAVKTLYSDDKNRRNPESQREALLDEARMLASVKHENIVELTGITLIQSNGGHDQYGLIFHRYTSGSLKCYLIANRNDLKKEDPIMYSWAYQIASGLSYLSSRGIYHLDIAARNVLLQDPEKSASIADFGLAKFSHEVSAIKRLNVNCTLMPPEVLYYLLPVNKRELRRGDSNAVFSAKTDVWSFGILLWEIFIRGEFPYLDQRFQNEAGQQKKMKIQMPTCEKVNDKHVSDLLTCFNSGWRLRSPWHCKPSELHPTYRTMLDCWNLEPSERPDFSTLAKTFAEQSPDKKNFEARNTDLKVAYSTIVRPTKGAEAGNDQQGEGEKEYLEVIPSPEKEELLRENAPVDFVSDVLF